MSLGGRPIEQLPKAIAEVVREPIRLGLEESKRGRKRDQWITHAKIAATTSAEYPEERDVQWVTRALSCGNPLTRTAARELLTRAKLAGLRRSRSHLIRYERHLGVRPRPYLIVPPGQSKPLAALIV